MSSLKIYEYEVNHECDITLPDVSSLLSKADIP